MSFLNSSNSISWTVTGEPTPTGCLCYTIEVPKDLLTNGSGEFLYLEYTNCDGNFTLLNTNNTPNLETETSQIYAVCASISPQNVRYGIGGDSGQAPTQILYTQGEVCTSDAGCQLF